jgi:hypothetical protein
VSPGLFAQEIGGRDQPRTALLLACYELSSAGGAEDEHSVRILLVVVSEVVDHQGLARLHDPHQIARIPTMTEAQVGRSAPLEDDALDLRSTAASRDRTEKIRKQISPKPRLITPSALLASDLISEL